MNPYFLLGDDFDVLAIGFSMRLSSRNDQHRL